MGAVKVIGGDLTLTGVTLSNNTGYLGGAVSYEPQAAGDSLTVVNSTFTGNTANTGTGGALLIQAYASQTNSITGSTFANNTGSSNGAIMVWSTGAFVSTTTIAHSTFSANAATNTAGADAIYGYGDSQVSITYTTFSGHSSDTAGSTAGILNVTNGADMVLAQSIIANNPAGGTPRECTGGVGTTFTGNQNLTADAFCPGRIAAAINVNATLASNGGPTQTHALTAGSNAIDVVAVSGSCVPGTSADQRGAARANGASAGGSACDLGAYEFASTVTPTAVAMAQPTAAVFPPAILLWMLALAMLGLTVTAVVKHGG